jgi:hypothetical protein
LRKFARRASTAALVRAVTPEVAPPLIRRFSYAKAPFSRIAQGCPGKLKHS